jgi:orotate phosphoribosyltransferase
MSSSPPSRLDKFILEGFAHKDTVHWNDSPVTLKSGVKSHVYVSARAELTEDSELLYMIGEKIARTVQGEHERDNEERRPCFIGIPTAGTPLATAVALASYRECIRYNRQTAGSRIMYEQRKFHGLDIGWIAGGPIDFNEWRVWLLDNTVTDGGTKEEVLRHLEEDGIPRNEISAIVLIDRQQGGLEAMQAMGLKRVIALYSILDVARAFEKMGHWDSKRLSAVEKEILDQ